MTQMTYAEATGAVLETTDMGYTLKSQDKLWICFIFDLTSTDMWYGNRLYPVEPMQRWSYDMWDDCLVWTSRKEAEAFRANYEAHVEHVKDEIKGEMPKMYVLNWGDDHRWERAYLEQRIYLREGKFAGSWEALNAMSDQWPKTSKHNEKFYRQQGSA